MADLKQTCDYGMGAPFNPQTCRRTAKAVFTDFRGQLHHACGIHANVYRRIGWTEVTTREKKQ